MSKQADDVHRSTVRLNSILDESNDELAKLIECRKGNGGVHIKRKLKLKK
jgi:hypothetical protein